jgi:iron(III) transport system ATP-binding protein
VVLLDEPFSNLDAPQRERMRRELKRIIRSAGVTAVLVTHDQAEALAIADVIAVMRDGAIRQVGTPSEVYRSPSDPWIADFLGDAIVLSGTVKGGTIATTVGSVQTDVADGTTARVMIRPEWLRPAVVDSGQGEVVDTEFYGHDQRIEIALSNGDHVEALVPSLTSISIGDSVDLEILDAVVFPS